MPLKRIVLLAALALLALLAGGLLLWRSLQLGPVMAYGPPPLPPPEAHSGKSGGKL